MRNLDRITKYYAAHIDVNGRHFSLTSPKLSRSPTKRVSAIPRKQSAADHADLTADGRGGRVARGRPDGTIMTCPRPRGFRRSSPRASANDNWILTRVH